MAMTSRNYLLARRGTGIGDLSECDNRNGNVDAWSDAYIASVAANNVAQIGIGTETEVGLELDRYPIRVVLVGGSEAKVTPTVTVHYWAVLNAASQSILFTRMPTVSAIAIENIYKIYQNFDTLWAECADLSATVAFAMTETATTMSDSLWAIIRNASPTVEQLTQAGATIGQIISSAKAAKSVAYIRIGENAFLVSRRHGSDGGKNGGALVPGYAAIEQNLTFQVNFLRFARNYPALSVGLRTACAFSVAWMISMGLYECYESCEVVTLVVSNNPEKKFPIVSRVAPPAYNWHESLAVGAVIDCSELKLHKTLMSVASALAYLAGVNHYTFNHTTNGMVLGGPMLSAFLMYKLFKTGAAEANEEEQTRLVYETLHPVNKRAIANIFFPNSKVTTWGRNFMSPRMRTIELDAFCRLRDKPVPAGAHKAFLSGIVLERILRQQWAAFLPWVGEIPNVVDMIGQIVNQGARSHVGAAYYTGMPGLVQGSQLDPYLPDLAQFIQTMAKRDTLAMSPHLSGEVAARADTRWSNLLKSIRGNEVTAVPIETVQAYLKTTGTFTIGFDAEKPETWGAVAESSLNQAKVLGEILRNPIQ